MAICRVALTLYSATLLFVVIYAENEEINIECRDRPLDVVFMLDGSRSVRPRNFQVIKDYVKNFTGIFEAFGPNDMQVGVIQFGSAVREEIQLNQYTDRHELMQAIDNIRYMQTGTMTGVALETLVTETLTVEHGARVNNPIVRTVVVIITDGKSQDYSRGGVTTWTREAMARGFEIFAIGIGRKANHRELLEMASEPKSLHKFHVKNFDAIQMVDVNLKDRKVCDVDECEIGNYTCEQMCVNTEGSYVCDCYEGFTLNDDQKTCYDSDPCLSNPCSHICTLTGHGFFICSCPIGMHLEEDEVHCTYIPPPNPSHLHAVNVTHTSATASWSIDQSKAYLVDHYVLMYARADGEGKIEVRQVYQNTTEDLIDLDPNVKYNISVLATNKYDISIPIENNFKTLALGETELHLSNPTLTTLLAAWTPAGGDGLTGYKFSYMPKVTVDERIGVSPLPHNVVQYFGAEVHETRLTGLEPNTNYTAEVVPLHGDHFGNAGTDNELTDVLQSPIVAITNTTLSTLYSQWGNLQYPVNEWEVKISSEATGVTTVMVESEQRYKIFKMLQPGTEYQVEVIGHVEESGRHFKSPVGLANQATESLTAPRVHITNTTDTTAIVEWTDINMPADSWSVKIYPKGRNRRFETLEVVGEENSAQFESLKPSSLYAVEVVANVIEDGRTFVSPTGRDLDTTKPAAPINIEMISRGVTILTAHFDHSPGDQTGYEGDCVRSDGTKEPVVGTITETDDGMTIICDGLDSATQYDIRVRAKLADLQSEQVSTANITLAPPSSDLRVSNPTTHSLVANWEAPPSIVTDGYALTYKCEEGTLTTRYLDANTTTFLLPDLQPSSQYFVTVTAIVNGERSVPITSRGETLPEVIELQIDEVGFTSINVSWNASTVPHIGFYKITYSPINKPWMTSTVNAGADETALSLENLDTATEYTISVSAQYSESESEISQRNASTLALPPIGPLSFTEISDTSFVVNWQVPNNLPPSSYELTYWNEESDAVNLDGIKKTDVLIDGLDPATEYNVSVVAVYFETVESAPIHGNETTRNAIEGTCSCYTYLKSQERLEKTISQLVKQIEYLTHRIQPQLVPETLNHDTRT